MSKENLSIDDLTFILANVKNEQMELIQENPDLFPNIRLNAKFEGKLDLLMYMFHFLGLGTKEELEKTKEKIIEEIKQEIVRKKLWQN